MVMGLSGCAGYRICTYQLLPKQNALIIDALHCGKLLTIINLVQLLIVTLPMMTLRRSSGLVQHT
jgi:hypothetical protein